MSSDKIIDVRDISKFFRVHRSPIRGLLNTASLGTFFRPEMRQALNGVSFSVRKGESLGILGPNGSGKSTLLHMLAGTMAPSSGSIEICGKVAALLELGAGFSKDFSGRENALLNLEMFGIPSSEHSEKMKWIESFAEIGPAIDEPVRNYSSGMFVRLSFAVAASMVPDIFIVDEALAVGDVGFQQKCFRFMREELSGTSRLYVSHDISSLASVCDRCVVLDRGRVVFDGSTRGATVEYLRLVHDRSSHDSEDTKFVVSGPRDIDIVDCSITTASPGIVAPEEIVEINCDLFSKLPEYSLVTLGVIWSDVAGRWIFGRNSQEGFPWMLRVPPGRSSGKLSFRWPIIASGRYSLTIGIGDHVSVDAPQRLQCWAHGAGDVACLNPDPIHGVVGIKFDSVNIEANR